MCLLLLSERSNGGISWEGCILTFQTQFKAWSLGNSSSKGQQVYENAGHSHVVYDRQVLGIGAAFCSDLCLWNAHSSWGQESLKHTTSWPQGHSTSEHRHLQVRGMLVPRERPLLCVQQRLHSQTLEYLTICYINCVWGSLASSQEMTW